jgi:hypothetical protein
MKISELGNGEKRHASIKDAGNFDPKNIEVYVHGVGVYTLDNLKNRLKKRLMDFADMVDGNPEQVERILTDKGMDAFISMLKGYNEILADLNTPQMKRKRTLTLRRSKTESVESIIAALRHIKEGVPFTESMFRYGSSAYFETINLGRELHRAGLIENIDWESADLFESELGQSVRLKGVGEVYLDAPFMEEDELEEGAAGWLAGAALLASIWGVNNHFAQQAYDASPQLQKLTAYLEVAKQHKDSRMIDQLEDRIANHKLRLELGYGDVKGDDGEAIKVVYDKEGRATYATEAEYQGKDVELNKPKRGGSKKYYVYTKNPKTGKVMKISFGDPGLKTKSGNKKRASNFAARHNCEKKNDRTKAGYWACRLPRYGLVKGGKWW